MTVTAQGPVTETLLRVPRLLIPGQPKTSGLFKEGWHLCNNKLPKRNRGRRKRGGDHCHSPGSAESLPGTQATEWVPPLARLGIRPLQALTKT